MPCGYVPSRRKRVIFQENVRQIRTICEFAEYFLELCFLLPGGGRRPLGRVRGVDPYGLCGKGCRDQVQRRTAPKGTDGTDCSALAATQARNDRASLCALRAGGRPMAVPTTQDGGECGFARDLAMIPSWLRRAVEDASPYGVRRSRVRIRPG